MDPLEMGDEAAMEMPIRMDMGAFGARGELLRLRGTGLGLALKSDGFLVRMRSDADAGESVLMADAYRGRFLEAGLDETTGTRTSRVGWRFGFHDLLRVSIESGSPAGGPGKGALPGRGLTVRGSLRR